MTKIDKRKFARAVRVFREEKDLTQLELANAIKTTSNTVARWERGETVPKNELVLNKLREIGITW
ncbi:MAG: helix-turn-helix transcriptional regulator [Candidatus Omnitrophica bacterium]|nr:helix-turn-helix transcriptional regulator [Candidatus Omnitrophota bacterium]MBL7072875.1 helix-turn-helix transcriptional regulator [Candidatus Omnitrophota bacterium]